MEGSEKKPVLVAMGKDAEMLLRDSYNEKYHHKCDLTAEGYVVMRISHSAVAVSMERCREEHDDAIKVLISMISR